MSIEELLEQPYYIMDILPMQVPTDSGRQYFKVEQYYLNHVERLSCQYADVLLKLNCYYDLVFSYDAEAGQLTSNQEIFINGDENELYYYEWFTNMSMTKLNEVAATPATPVIGSFKYTEGSTMSFGRLSYEIPTVGTNGEALLTSKLSYQIMIDKDGQVQPLKLTTDLYEALTEDMEIIPYNFSDDYDIYNYVIYLNQPKDEIFSWKKVGVKSIYSAAGETHESQIAWFDLENYVTGINATAADKGDVRFFDLQGRAANGSAKGMLLKQTRLADGNVKTVKVIRK
jgi:L-rhamnose mutarotase